MLPRSRTSRLIASSAALTAGLVIVPLAVAFAVEQGPASKTVPKGQQTSGSQTAILAAT